MALDNIADGETNYADLEDCLLEDMHMVSVDDDGFCNNCGCSDADEYSEDDVGYIGD